MEIFNPFNLKGKKILITGASSGIGREIAIFLSKQGAIPIILARTKNKLIETLSLFEYIEESRYFVCDLTNMEQIKSLANEIDILDGVVFNAGLIDYVPIKVLSVEKIRKIFSLNFDSQVILTQQLLNTRKINNGSSLVYISSISSHLGVPGTAIYAASKAAITSFAKVLASELSSKKIRVNIVSPGIVKTSLFDAVSEKVNLDVFKKEEELYPLGYGTPTDVANAVSYLLSGAARWVTGTEIVLDGGFTLKK
jgi:NAD(P)-dependent dehydrogenase (short-subunit alcohol dehydrogenase family)